MKDIIYKTTTDHSIIKSWVEKRMGKPVAIKQRETPGVNEGVISIEFETDGRNSVMHSITWDEFFTRFDQSHLAFQYIENGQPELDTYYKFIDCDGE